MPELTDYKCWICLGSADEPPPHGGFSEWRRTCKCNLIAHEICILDWAAEMNTGTGTKRRPECPQCKMPIKIVKKSSAFLSLRETIESLNANGFRIVLLTAITGSALSAIYTSLYAVGATSIRFMCPPEMALRLLGITIRETSVKIQPLTIRRMILIPAIPLALLLSGTQSALADLLLCMLPLGIAEHKLPFFSGPSLTVALLPWLRLLYQQSYAKLIDPIIQAAATKVKPRMDWDHEINFQLMIDMGANENPNNQDNPDANVANANANGNVNQRDVPDVAVAANNLPGGGPGAVRGPGGALANGIVPRNPIENFALRITNWLARTEDESVHTRRRIGTGDWVISPRRLTLRVGNALLLPFLSGLLGSGLSSIPFIRKIIPDRFNRNVIGGIIVIGVRDLINVISALLRVTQENSQRVVEYFDDVTTAI